MQHFQSILIVIGLIAIGGVLIHGYLTNRKEQKSSSKRGDKVDIFAEKSTPQESVDAVDDVISDVRIIGNNPRPAETDDIDFSLAINDDKLEPVAFSDEHQSTDRIDDIDVATTANETNIADLPAEETVEPQVETMIEESISAPALDEKAEDSQQAPDLFIFNVAAKEGEMLGGHELLQFFLTSGFRHGEMSIFHRHEHSDGTGPVLFSIANMMAPGVFDTDNMEQFRSEGVSFFLTAPNKDINVKASFDLMLRAVEQMAEEFDCEVLNEQREKMTTEQFIEYNNRLMHYM